MLTRPSDTSRLEEYEGALDGQWIAARLYVLLGGVWARIQGCAGALTPAALDRVRYRTFWLPLGARLVSVQQVMLP